MNKKKSRKKSYRPKYIIMNPIKELFGGMSDTHIDSLQRTMTLNHMAMVAMVQGRGDRSTWDRLVGANNMALVMTEQGIGEEFRDVLKQWHDVMVACGVRSVKKDRFLFTGDELKIVNEGMSCHDTQLRSVRAIDLDRAADEVERRLRHRINSTSVVAELKKQEAEKAAQH